MSNRIGKYSEHSIGNVICLLCISQAMNPRNMKTYDDLTSLDKDNYEHVKAKIEAGLL